jgi:hypothetical protein
MKRWSLLIGGLCLAMTGCGGTPASDPNAWDENRWMLEKAQNQQRLLPEDQRESPTMSGWMGDTFFRANRLINNLYQLATGETPLVAAERIEDRYFPDERRMGVAYLSDFSWGRGEPYTDRYRQLVVLDNDRLVKASALRALNRARDQQAVDLFIKSMSDQRDIVRVEAAKALANIPSEKAIPVLIKAVANERENRDVRVWSADALRNFPKMEVAQALIRVLNDRDFSVAWQARRSLRFMTGQDYAFNDAAWLQYLTQTQNPFG